MWGIISQNKHPLTSRCRSPRPSNTWLRLSSCRTQKQTCMLFMCKSFDIAWELFEHSYKVTRMRHINLRGAFSEVHPSCVTGAHGTSKNFKQKIHSANLERTFLSRPVSPTTTSVLGLCWLNHNCVSVFCRWALADVEPGREWWHQDMVLTSVDSTGTVRSQAVPFKKTNNFQYRVRHCQSIQFTMRNPQCEPFSV